MVITVCLKSLFYPLPVTYLTVVFVALIAAAFFWRLFDK